MLGKIRRMCPLCWQDSVILVVTMAVVLDLGLLLQPVGADDCHAALLFVTGVLVVARSTNGYFYGMTASLIAAVVVNYAFMEPYYRFELRGAGYPFTFVTLFSVSIVTSALTTHIKEQEEAQIEAERERLRANLLRAVGHDLRTPLTSIIGSAEAILSPGNCLSDEENRTLLRNVCSEAEWMIRMVPEGFGGRTITGDLVSEGEVVLLVMPQDIQAPKGRLILPQVQTMRELLDKKCIVLSTTTDKLVEALDQLKNPPKLIITDSQVFDYVYDHKPTESLLTSFSVLFADYKGDLDYYKEGAKKLMNLSSDSRVLIAECCTHAPLKEDIGREKIPRMLKKKYGETLKVTVVSGTDYPKDLTSYDLIIQCGACMFNRKYVLHRIQQAKDQGVAMTNYGVAIAQLKGILDKIVC